MAKPLQHGDVVLVPFPFADLTGGKVRPAVIMSADPQEAELILAFITSVLTNRSRRGAEVELLRTDPEFAATGLRADSLIRLDKLVTLSRSTIARRMGTVGPATQARITLAVRRALGL